MLRCIEVGLSVPDLDFLEYGEATDIIIEKGNDSCDYKQIATQDDFDKF